MPQSGAKASEESRRIAGGLVYRLACMKRSGQSVTRQAVRVRFGETDLMGIVHHAVYLSYFEAGRVEYLRRRGFDAVSWAGRGLHLPVVEARARYRKSARFDEILVVETSLLVVTRVTLDFGYRILRDDVLLAEGNTLLACVGDDHAPKRIPPEAVEALVGPERLERDEQRV